MSLDLLIDKQKNKEINEKKLNKVWSRIQPSERPWLNNYYAMDLTDILYEYGMLYNRKDILKLYVTEKEKSTDKKQSKREKRRARTEKTVAALSGAVAGGALYKN